MRAATFSRSPSRMAVSIWQKETDGDWLRGLATSVDLGLRVYSVISSRTRGGMSSSRRLGRNSRIIPCIFGRCGLMKGGFNTRCTKGKKERCIAQARPLPVISSPISLLTPSRSDCSIICSSLSIIYPPSQQSFESVYHRCVGIEAGPRTTWFLQYGNRLLAEWDNVRLFHFHLILLDNR